MGFFEEKKDEGLIKVTTIKVGLVDVEIYTDGVAYFLKCPKCGSYFICLEDLKKHWSGWCADR